MVDVGRAKPKRAWRFKAVSILVLIGAASGVAALILTQRSDVAAERSELEDTLARGLRPYVCLGGSEELHHIIVDVSVYLC